MSLTICSIAAGSASRIGPGPGGLPHGHVMPVWPTRILSFFCASTGSAVPIAADAASRENVRRSTLITSLLRHSTVRLSIADLHCRLSTIDCRLSTVDLKPPRPRRGPSLDDDFFLCKELDRVSALSVQIAEETVPRATEREECHGRSHGDVDADIADFGLVAKPSRVRTARREQARLIAVGACVHECNGFVHGLDVVCRQHR